MKKPILIGFIMALAAAPLPAIAAGEAPTATTTNAYSTEDELTEKYGDLGTNYTAAVALIDAGQYKDAVVILDSLGKGDDPRVLNYLGFTHRKLGKHDKAITFYEKALKIEPHFAAAHEYLGEAYVESGKIDKATAQLDKIKSICGTDCSEYSKLDTVIKAHKAKS